MSKLRYRSSCPRWRPVRACALPIRGRSSGATRSFSADITHLILCYVVTDPVSMATEPPLEVYLDLLSQPCRAVYILLSCTRIPHRVRTVALRKGQPRSTNQPGSLPTFDPSLGSKVQTNRSRTHTRAFMTYVRFLFFIHVNTTRVM